MAQRDHHYECVHKRCPDSSSDYKTNKRRRSSDERQHRAGLTDSCMWSWAASHRNDQRQLRYYVQLRKSPDLKLRDGYTSRFVKRDNRVKEKLDHVLKWILANRDRFTKKIWVLETNVTWRGHLTKVLTTPYETQEGWMLAASKFRGTIYISEVETEAARVHRETRSERQEEMMCWGYKSEQYLCADASGRP
uniref:Decapping nuclease n=1 Tax=Cyprinus carpio TaxID=7962 RepID=A0A8C2PRU4_CYPCA